MLNALMHALEESNVSFNLWNYNPSNTDTLGDDWNAENFSFYSDENRRLANSDDPDAGGRLLDVLVRPYAIACSGTPIESAYDIETNLFTLKWKEAPYFLPSPTSPPPKAKVTEIFLPSNVYQKGKYSFHASLGSKVVFDSAKQRAFVWFDDDDDTLIRGEKGVYPTRRFDIWVRAADDKRNPIEWVGLAVVIAACTFFVLNEWKRHTEGAGWVEMIF